MTQHNSTYSYYLQYAYNSRWTGIEWHHLDLSAIEGDNVFAVLAHLRAKNPATLYRAVTTTGLVLDE